MGGSRPAPPPSPLGFGVQRGKRKRVQLSTLAEGWALAIGLGVLGPPGWTEPVDTQEGRDRKAGWPRERGGKKDLRERQGETSGRGHRTGERATE